MLSTLTSIVNNVGIATGLTTPLSILSSLHFSVQPRIIIEHIMSSMSLSTTQDFGTATPAGVSPVAPINSASPDNTDSITIVVSIIGAVLALASVVVAILQYRIQAQRKLDVERDGQPIEMNPQHYVREARGAVPAALS
jgi:beta-lactamase regulating signal transducer with metallopeptidase domain